MKISARCFIKSLVQLSVVLILLIAGLTLIFPVALTHADTQPASGPINLGGVVPGLPPPTAAVITIPQNNQHFKQFHIMVSGTCPATTIVELYKNNIFAGSTTCTASGTFSLQIDLVKGENQLQARVHDALNQYGPDSNIVTVYYDAITSGVSLPQLVLIANALYQGESNIKPLTIEISISGGQAPYAISINWGDNSNPDLTSRPNGNKFTISHIYRQPGNYRVVIKGTDTLSNDAYLEIVGIVNGPIYKNFSGITSSNLFDQALNVILIILIAILILIIFFWAGERWEFHELKEEDRIKDKNSTSNVIPKS